MYPLGTWFVSGICVWIPCIKTTMMMMMMMIMMIMMIIIVIIIIIISFVLIAKQKQHTDSLCLKNFFKANLGIYSKILLYLDNPNVSLAEVL